MSLASMEAYLDVIKFLRHHGFQYMYNQNIHKEDIFIINSEETPIELVIHEHYISIEMKNFIVIKNLNNIDYYMELLRKSNTNWQFRQTENAIHAKRIFGVIGCTIEELFDAFVREYEELAHLRSQLQIGHLPITA